VSNSAYSAAPKPILTLKALRDTTIAGLDAQNGQRCVVAAGQILELLPPAPEVTENSVSFEATFTASQGCPLTRATLYRADWTSP
jgi:hypothetical protein